MLFVASTTEAFYLSLLVCLQACYSWYPIHKYLRGYYHWVLLAGHVVLLGLCVDATSSVKIIQLSLLKIMWNSIILQILRLIGNIIIYIYIYPLRIFTGTYEPINWFSMVQYSIFIENHCWILLSTYTIVMRIFSSP